MLQIRAIAQCKRSTSNGHDRSLLEATSFGIVRIKLPIIDVYNDSSLNCVERKDVEEDNTTIQDITSFGSSSKIKEDHVPLINICNRWT